MTRHDPKILRAFMDGETRQVWARVRATGEPVYLEDGTADSVRATAKAKWACIVPDCYARITTRGGSRRHCFVHDGGSSHGGGGPESVNHLASKAMLWAWATAKAQTAEVVEERTIKDSDTRFDRRPDVLVTWTDGTRAATLALEVEYKRFTYESWKAKQDSFELNGVMCTWLLGHTRLKPQISDGGSWDLAVKVPRQAQILAGAGQHVLVINPITRQIGTLAGDKNFSRKISSKQQRAWIALDAIDDCDLTCDGIITPTMRQIDEATRARNAALEEDRRLRNAELADRLRRIQLEAEERERRLTEANARREQERALRERWDQERRAWGNSALRGTFIERWGKVPAVIDDFGEKPRGIDGNPAHWHAVLYENLIHAPDPGTSFTVGDCWTCLQRAGFDGSRSNEKRLTSLTNFLATLEANHLIKAGPDGTWIVRARIPTREEVRQREERERLPRLQAAVEQHRREEEQAALAAAAAADDEPAPQEPRDDPTADTRQSRAADPQPAGRLVPHPVMPPPPTPTPWQPPKRGRLRMFLARLTGR